MSEFRTCTTCKEPKLEKSEYYLCGGKIRNECKKCTIKRNSLHQQKNKSWKDRYFSDEERRKYMRKYYKKNKSKFKKYRDEFAERHPGYYKHYYESRKAVKKAEEANEASSNRLFLN